MKQFFVILLAVITCNILFAQNVGIGTNAPTLSKLQVLGSGNGTHGLFTDGTTGISLITELSRPGIGLNMTYNGGGYKFQGNGYGSLFYYVPSSGNLTYYSSSATGIPGGTVSFNSVLTMQPGGNIGIGTTTPDELLDVNGNILTTGSMYIDNAAATLQLKSAGVSMGFLQLSGDDLRMGTNSGNNSGKFIVRTNGGDRFWVDSAGNVTVGTSYKVASGYKVSVNGKIMCEEVRVQMDADWPDYVFATGYKLMPLTDLQRFITTNKHLPGMLPAAEVKANGIDLGDTNKRMLEKIEELTLYILALKKEIDLLKSMQQH
jgi:hypothetical protein